MERLNINKNKGITLIALVTTVIVLLILAGVSIAMLTGDNGILTQAQKADEQTEIAEEKEQIALAYNGAKIEKEGGYVLDTDLDTQFGLNGTNADAEGSNPITVTFLDSGRAYTIDENGNITGPLEEPEMTPEPPTGGTSFDMSNGVIEIKWLKDDTYYVSETANAPIVKTDLPANTTMKLVKYQEGKNGAEGTWVEGTDYNYVAGTGTADNNSSKWANAKVTIDEIDSYFVWIPRYAYRIVYFSTAETKNEYLTNGSTEGIVGYSDSRGIVDKEGKQIDGVTSYQSINVGDYFMPHPAFINDSNNNFENGGWDEELPGIWVGKYEAAKSNATLTSEGSGNTIKIQPRVRCAKRKSVGTLYENAKLYSVDLNSHMLKNSEWGAVAYLTESKYGRNGTEVTINNDSDYVTGAAGNSVSEPAGVGSSPGTNDYWDPKGVLASSTGNVTGIYDLSGCSREYVAAYHSYSDNGDINNGIQLVNETNKKFVMIYENKRESIGYKLGDATYEVDNWHSDSQAFYNGYQFFLRGGAYRNNTGAGIFEYRGYNGNDADSGNYGTVRVCLAIK